MKRLAARPLVAALALATIAGCGGGAKSNRTPVDVRGTAIRPVSTVAPEGTLSEVAPASQPEQFTLRRGASVPARADTATKVVRVDPPPRVVRQPDSTAAPARAVTVSPPASSAPAATTTPAPPVSSSPARPAPPDQFLAQDPPQVISRVPAVAPERARQARVGGTVLVKALVGTDGLVRATRIARSIPELDSAAMACVRQWKFKPAMSSGVPVATWTDVPVRFLLQ